MTETKRKASKDIGLKVFNPRRQLRKSSRTFGSNERSRLRLNLCFRGRDNAATHFRAGSFLENYTFDQPTAQIEKRILASPLARKLAEERGLD